MTRITEHSIEDFAIKLLEHLGYEYIYAPSIAHDGESPERSSYEEVLLTHRMAEAVRRINPTVPPAAQEEAIKEIQRIHSPELLSNNESFHRLLTEGIKVSYQKDGQQRGDLVWLIDFNTPENNDFIVANQFTVVEDGVNKRPDVILFINGLPLVVIELKNAADENATIKSAFRQIETYKAVIPSLFTYNAFTIISDGLEARAGTLSSGMSRFMAWKSADGKEEASHLVSQMETLINGMLNKETLLDLVRHFIVFEKSKKEDAKTGVTTISTVKKLAAYHQYYAVNRAVESALRATGYTVEKETPTSMVMESPESYGVAGVKSQPKGDRKGGVVWHTQGSGKSLSMVFFTGKIVLALDNPTVVVITDRNDLDDQLFDTFASSTQLLRQEPKQIENRNDLKEKLKVASGGVIFTTIQKFSPEEGNVYETLSERENIVVIADEAHRTQYGFKAKTVDDKDEHGNVIGKKTVYGFAKYMRDALPNATYIGFTGTPIESTDVNTPAVFGNYIDVYDIAQAVEDGATVRIYYESRLAKVNLSEEGKKLVEELDDELDGEELTETQKAKAKWTQLEALIGSENRIKNVANDIIQHFGQRQEVFEGKGMIVAMSRRIAADLYEEIIKLKPEWHSDDLDKGVIKVVMTSSSSDGPKIAKHHTTKQQRRTLADRMKDPDDELKLVIVRDMWLTGFDAPSMHTLYIDKPMKGHNLMQAIARVNRVYKDKPGGLVVDYLGIASDLKKALSFYSDAGGKGDPTIAQAQAVELMLEKLEVVSQMYSGFPYEDYFQAETGQKLSMILAAEEHILGLEDGKKRYINEVTALSKAFAIAVPHEQAMDVKDEVSFFQAVKARLAKFDGTGSGRTDEEIETTIRQVIDQALVSEQVIDVFDAAGIKKPDISILSEDFLMELKGMEHKNVALEVLKKLLNDEIKARSKKNLVKSKSLKEMLENSIKKYHNKILTAAEVMDELIKLSKEIVNMDSEAKKLGLSDFEYAFYTAVANNDSAKQLMQQDKLRELAVILTERVKQNASIDWTIKESVSAKLKVIIKRTLRQYGYPPDMQKLATETVLKQAEMIAKELTTD
ncbi:type I restriction endonuclease subunit R [Seonamhaeicola sediminis]|uniref:Type I restriction enzyme endonuclease subunit n=1 Tax=Seonamhaeicola sediminis TaxID=2528206 RepID=A0A562Y8T2_9FLAO|nr:type I restriction endonuclease subunit R [Seonamhaeicola sediminis]TWO30672.1 type I restriction endonuclease subunit R [Seonamhaeicola sediminis]